MDSVEFMTTFEKR